MGEEDPYSQIFSSLKHPTRRLILRGLSQGQAKRFGQLQQEIGVDSPTLSYHLEALQGLVEKQGDLYKLTELGSASYNLMHRVEEPPQPRSVTPRRDRIRLGIAWSMVIILLFAGLFGLYWTFPANPILNDYTTIPYSIGLNNSTYFFVGLKYASNVGTGAQNGIWPADISRPSWTPWAWTVNYALFYPTFDNGTVLLWLTAPNGQRAPNQALNCNPPCDQYAPNEIGVVGNGGGTGTFYTTMTTEGEYSIHLQNVGQGLATGKVQFGLSTTGYYRPGFFVGLVFLIPSLIFTTYSVYHLLKPTARLWRRRPEK